MIIINDHWDVLIDYFMIELVSADGIMVIDILNKILVRLMLCFQ